MLVPVIGLPGKILGQHVIYMGEYQFPQVGLRLNNIQLVDVKAKTELLSVETVPVMFMSKKVHSPL